MSAVLSADLRAGIERLAARYPRKAAALLPVLHVVQNDRGFIGPDEEAEVAVLLGIGPIEVREVVTFYTMFRRRPVGRRVVQVCSNLSCTLMGGERILDYLKKKLAIGVGETTSDGRFTLTTVECLGACEQAPCLMIDFDYHGNLTEEKIVAILGGAA